MKLRFFETMNNSVMKNNYLCNPNFMVMKKLWLVLVMCVVACSAQAQTGDNTEIQNQYTTLRKIMGEGDFSQLKTYFSFPVSNPDIWRKVLTDEELQTADLKKDFTEQDFDTYADKLFPKAMRMAIRSMDVKNLSYFRNVQGGNIANKMASSPIMMQENGLNVQYELRISLEKSEIEMELFQDVLSLPQVNHKYEYEFELKDGRLMFKDFDVED